jgi:hypothetical protein
MKTEKGLLKGKLTLAFAYITVFFSYAITASLHRRQSSFRLVGAGDAIRDNHLDTSYR